MSSENFEFDAPRYFDFASREPESPRADDWFDSRGKAHIQYFSLQLIGNRADCSYFGTSCSTADAGAGSESLIQESFEVSQALLVCNGKEQTFR